MAFKRMLQDGGKRTYVCGPTECGYDGKQYCQNCGYAKGERAKDKAAFGLVEIHCIACKAELETKWRFGKAVCIECGRVQPSEVKV